MCVITTGQVFCDNIYRKGGDLLFSICRTVSIISHSSKILPNIFLGRLKAQTRSILQKKASWIQGLKKHNLTNNVTPTESRRAEKLTSLSLIAVLTFTRLWTRYGTRAFGLSRSYTMSADKLLLLNLLYERAQSVVLVKGVLSNGSKCR